jgi:serine/threonine protein kinase
MARSELLNSSVPTDSLQTVNTVRRQRSASQAVRTVDAVSLPFIVVSKFVQADPDRMHYQYLSPGQLPEIESDIGYGASFVVQKATVAPKPGKQPERTAVALKRIRPSSTHTRESFQCVINDLLCLTHPPLRSHENIIDLLGLGWETSPADGDYRLWPYLILEYSSIGSLADLQKTPRILTHQQKLTLSLDVAKGLHAIHHSNVIHGDIKSENVLVFPDRTNSYVAKLSDFGFAILDVDFLANNDTKMSIDEERKTARIPTGTRPWSAPEFGKIASWQHAFKADVYSWGLLVWRIFLDGQNPFTVFRTQFESLSIMNSAHDIQTWKEQNFPLFIALIFVLSLRSGGSKALETAFRNSLDVEPAKRDLRAAYLPWIFGARYLSLTPIQSRKR